MGTTSSILDECIEQVTKAVASDEKQSAKKREAR